MGAGFAAPKVGRGAAFGDVELDGDLDVLVTTNGGPAALYRNDVAPNQRSLDIIAGRMRADGAGAGHQSSQSLAACASWSSIKASRVRR